METFAYWFIIVNGTIGYTIAIAFIPVVLLMLTWLAYLELTGKTC